MFWLWACVVESSAPAVLDSSALEEPATEPDPILSLDASLLPAAADSCREPTLAWVNYVVDGDTVFAQVGAQEEKIRLIGIDTPELGYDGDPDECYAQEATLFLRDMIDERWVWLTFDRQCVDTYDRTLAYIHIDLGTQGFVQRQQLQRGVGRAFPFDDTPAFTSSFLEDAAQASSAGLGGWGACGWE